MYTLDDLYILTSLGITAFVILCWIFLPKILYMVSTGLYSVSNMSKVVTILVIVIFGFIQLWLMVEMWCVVADNLRDV